MSQEVYEVRDFEKPVWVLTHEGMIVKAETVRRCDQLDEYKVFYNVPSRPWVSVHDFIRVFGKEGYVSENKDRLLFEITPDIIEMAQAVLQAHMDSYTKEFEAAKQKYDIAKSIYNATMQSFEALRLGIE